MSSTGSSVCFGAVAAVELTLNPERFSSHTHPPIVIPVLCPPVTGGTANWIVVDMQTQQLLYSAKNLPCFRSGLRWTGSTFSERMAGPNSVTSCICELIRAHQAAQNGWEALHFVAFSSVRLSIGAMCTFLPQVGQFLKTNSRGPSPNGAVEFLHVFSNYFRRNIFFHYCAFHIVTSSPPYSSEYLFALPRNLYLYYCPSHWKPN